MAFDAALQLATGRSHVAVRGKEAIGTMVYKNLEIKSKEEKLKRIKKRKEKDEYV
jgi:hypothetical protein